MKILTLCIVHQGERVLLGMKKRGFGQGRWNGFGGKIKEGETVGAAALREMQEEAEVAITKMEEMGILEFELKDTSEILEVHVFKVHEFEGEPTESEEMKPQWFYIDAIPFREMWPDDAHWFPLFLKGKKFRGKFLFGPANEILEYDLQETQ